MNSQRQKPTTPWPLIVLFFIVSAVTILGSILYFTNQKKNLLENTTNELSAIADLKIKQIIQWRHERIADGNFLSNNSTVIRQFSELIKGNREKNLSNDLLNFLKGLIENYDYKTAQFIDRDCKVRLFYPNSDTVLGDYLNSKLPEIMHEGKVVMTDLHQVGKVSFVHIDLIVPLREPGAAENDILGVIALRIDPQKVLYPLLQSWPVTSKTSETLLFRTEGNEIVYLNELRHIKNSELALRRPINEKGLAASMALQGVQSSVDAIDYRGVPVIAVMKKVPESPWYMVGKVDREEVFVSMIQEVRFVLITVVLFILTTGFFLGFLWWNQRVRFYREKYEAELDRLAIIRHFDYILKYANDIILLIDKDYVIVEANDRALETYQYDRNEIIGMKISNLRSHDSLSKLPDDLRILNDAGHSTFEAVHRRKDGTTIPIEISARIVEIEGVKYYQSISRDITERKRSEEVIRESEMRFRKIFEDSPFCMLMTGKDMGIIRANSAFCDLIGYSEEDLLGLTFRNFTHPEHIRGDEVSLLDLVAGKIPLYNTEKRYIRKDGSVIWGSTTVSIIRNNKGEVHIFIVMVEDITSRKMAAEELNKSFSLLKATLESTADGILVVDNTGKIIQYNKKFGEMWRIPEQVMNLNDDESALQFVLDQLKYPDQFINKVRELYSDHDAITFDTLEFHDGRFFERYSQPQKISGETVGRVWSFRDISERKRAETELIAAKNKAEESDRLKTAFLHNVSHEIRTPMNAILGFSTLLNEPDLSEKDKTQFIDVIFQSGNQLLSIINDIVDLASIESGQVKVNQKVINLNNTLKRISEQFSYREKSHKITLSLKTPLHLEDAEILTDSTKLVQIISNLINNAFKFTTKGSIDFGYDLKDGFLEFFVKDTGIGIPEEYHLKIFDRFYQVDNAVSRQFAGTGLGLSICKAYVELLGGKIWLDSKPGTGTIFRFTIPYVKKS